MTAISRALRIGFAGAPGLATSRSDRRERIFEDDAERLGFLDLLSRVAEDFEWLVHAPCLMGNHYHLLMKTSDGNPDEDMRQLNGVQTYDSSRRHGWRASAPGGYKAILSHADSNLLELSSYVMLNPERAGMPKSVHERTWSSYPAMLGRRRRRAVWRRAIC